MATGQRSLFATGDPALDPSAAWERVELGDGSWVDRCVGAVRGADALLDLVVDAVPWRAGRRRMYDRMVDDPRMSYRCADRDDAPHASLLSLRDTLEHRYRVRFGPLAFNYYRDGRDSVAYHRDRELRDLDDALIAILTLGARRPFRMRPCVASSARTHDLAPASGDVLVMGGASQRCWEHGVPKVVSAGPRVSATWRWGGAVHVSGRDGR